jgi:hypothetical protein
MVVLGTLESVRHTIAPIITQTSHLETFCGFVLWDFLPQGTTTASVGKKVTPSIKPFAPPFLARVE